MNQKQRSLLDTLVRIIIETAEPDQIILFGSRVTDPSNPKSDYDFLVVMDRAENERSVSRRIYRAMLDRHVDVAVDIVVVDRRTLESRRNTRGMVYREALTKGKVVYDRTHSRDVASAG